MTNSNYFLKTGCADYERLSILSQIYNPAAIHFLRDSGVVPGMTILEIGCGTGHMACDLAKLVGPKGRVIAIDNSEQQIELAKQTAKDANINNIEFHVLDIRDLAKLGKSYDATYGRWVIEFTTQPDQTLATMLQHLKPGGILAYEAVNTKETQFFSSLYSPLIEKWHAFGPKIFASYGYSLDFADNVYHVFKKLGFTNIFARVNQGLLTTPEHKKVYRLGLSTATPAILAKNIMTQSEINQFCEELETLEESETICGFYKNILVSGIKPIKE